MSLIDVKSKLKTQMNEYICPSLQAHFIFETDIYMEEG